MIDIIKEVRESSDNPDLKMLDMRIGIHTGRVVAGIIGSKVVRYDIFGNGVLIANKMESNGIAGKVCISEDTKRIIQRSPDIAENYYFKPHEIVELSKIGKKIQTYIIEPITSSVGSESDNESVDLSEYYSELSESKSGSSIIERK